MFCLTDGAANIFHDSSLLLSPRTSHLMVEESPTVRGRESAHGAEEEEKKPKPLHYPRNSNPQPQSPALFSLLKFIT